MVLKLLLLYCSASKLNRKDYIYIFLSLMNYSDLARRHGLGDKKLGNMIVKEYLIEQGVNLQRYQQFRKRPAKPTRRLNKMLGGEITVPTPRTTREIKTLKVSHPFLNTKIIE